MTFGYWTLVILLIMGGLWVCVELAKDWPARPRGQRDARPGVDLHDRALPQLRAMAADRPRLGALLDEVERGRERARREANQPDGRYERDARNALEWTERNTVERAALLAHCRPATTADRPGPARAHLAAGRPLEAGGQDWHVLTSHPGRFPSLYGSSSVCVFIPASLPVSPANIPRTFHGGARHSTFWFERAGVVVPAPIWSALRVPDAVLAGLSLGKEI